MPRGLRVRSSVLNPVLLATRWRRTLRRTIVREQEEPGLALHDVATPHPPEAVPRNLALDPAGVDVGEQALAGPPRPGQLLGLQDQLGGPVGALVAEHGAVHPLLPVEAHPRPALVP